MDKKRQDRRVRRTQKDLQIALMELLKAKKLQEISVREVTERADINRGTFYLHYKNVHDLMVQIEESLLEEFREILHQGDGEGTREQPECVIAKIYSILYENSELLQLLMGENGDLNFINSLKQLIYENYLRDMLKDSEDSAAFSVFITSGCQGLIQSWFQNGLRETPEQMAELTASIIERSIGARKEEAGVLR